MERKKRTWLITFVLLQKRKPFVPRGVLWGSGGGRILGRSIKKGALKSLLSFMSGEGKRGKLKCMLLGVVSEHFTWLDLD